MLPIQIRWLLTAPLKWRTRANPQQISGVWGSFPQTGPSKKEVGAASKGRDLINNTGSNVAQEGEI